MAKEYIVRFFDGSTEYVSYGQDKDYMPVFHVRDGDHVKTMMRYPSCLSHMQYVTVRALRRMEREEIDLLYGQQLATKG